MAQTASPGRRNRLTRCAVALVLAFVLFAFLFLRAGGAFWLWLSLSVVALCAAAALAEPADMRAALARTDARSNGWTTLGIGLLSALVLYGLFFIGNLAARRLFPSGASDIESVYRFGSGTPRWVIAALLLIVVGPGEEFFWRGYVQRRLTAEFGVAGAALSVLAYTAVHLPTGNLTLILAAFVCGAFWAALYGCYHSVRVNLVSHAVWAAAIIVLFPMA